MTEKMMRTEDVRIPKHRDSYGACLPLVKSIGTEGLHRPITVWKDGTLISGSRRLRAYMLMDKSHIQAVFVGTIEEAAKRLRGDIEDGTCALPMKWSEVCRLWETLRRLDQPAAAKRLDSARRRGVELRRLTQAGKRKAGRTSGHSQDYTLTTVCEPFGISAATAARIETIYHTGYGTRAATDDKRELARKLMADLDAGGKVWPNYQMLTGIRHTAAPRRQPVAPVAAAPAARQVAAWANALPQMEGLTAGLAALGPPNSELTWNQVGPVHTRLMAIRRELEKIILQMREKKS